MPVMTPFRGLRATPDSAAAIIAPPYDVMSAAEARTMATGKPHSFLHVSRPEIDLPEGGDPTSPAAYQQAAANFQALRDSRQLIQDPEPCFYIYRLSDGAHQQTGVAAAASVASYRDGVIKKHELTRPTKEDDRVRHIEAVQAQTGPVLLTHQRNNILAALVAEQSAPDPTIDVTADDGVRHQLWIVSDPATTTRLSQALEAIDTFYIADGHHRCAAAARVAQAQANSGPGEHPADAFLAVLFPDTEMRILAYNRVIRDLNGLSSDAFIQQLTGPFAVEPQSTAVEPAGAGTFGLYLDGRWYRLSLNPDIRRQTAARPPAEQLDASLLQELLIQPILGIDNPRTNDRIDFVGGSRGIAGLTSPVDQGEMRLALSLYPTSIEQLMSVADANAIMPPKSTWFEPKLADGLLCHLIG